MDLYHILLGYLAWSGLWCAALAGEIDRILWRTDDTFVQDMSRAAVAMLGAGLVVPAALIATLGMDAYGWVKSKVTK